MTAVNICKIVVRTWLKTWSKVFFVFGHSSTIQAFVAWYDWLVESREFLAVSPVSGGSAAHHLLKHHGSCLIHPHISSTQGKLKNLEKSWSISCRFGSVSIIKSPVLSSMPKFVASQIAQDDNQNISKSPIFGDLAPRSRWISLLLRHFGPRQLPSLSASAFFALKPPVLDMRFSRQPPCFPLKPPIVAIKPPFFAHHHVLGAPKVPKSSGTTRLHDVFPELDLQG